MYNTVGSFLFVGLTLMSILYGIVCWLFWARSEIYDVNVPESSWLLFETARPDGDEMLPITGVTFMVGPILAIGYAFLWPLALPISMFFGIVYFMKYRVAYKRNQL